MSHELRLLTSGGAPGRSSTIVCMATIQLRPSRMCPTASKAAHALLAILVNRLSKSPSAQNSCLHLIGLRQTTVGRDAERVHHPAGELNDELYVRSTNLRQLAMSAGSYRVLPCALGDCALGASPTHAFCLTWLVLSQSLILRHFTGYKRVPLDGIQAGKRPRQILSIPGRLDRHVGQTCEV